MQDKFPIIIYEKDDTHITDLLLDFIEEFRTQLLDENKVCVKPFEPFSFKTVAQSHEIVNQMDFCTSIRRADNENRRNQIRFRNLSSRKH